MESVNGGTLRQLLTTLHSDKGVMHLFQLCICSQATKTTRLELQDRENWKHPAQPTCPSFHVYMGSVRSVLDHWNYGPSAKTAGSRISEGYVAELLHQALYALRHLHFVSWHAELAGTLIKRLTQD